jgi:copper homeostasis protein (lipoprotein)
MIYSVRNPRRASGSSALPAAALTLALMTAAGATSQGPVADGPYAGTLPCADCSGIRTALTLYSMGREGAPLVYRMTATYLGTPDGDRTEERLGPWRRLGDGPDAIVRIEPWNDEGRQSFRRADADRLVLLDREERPIDTRQNLILERDPTLAAARLEPPRTLFRGTLRRDEDELQLVPCAGGNALRVRDLSPEALITAAATDAGLDRQGRVYLEAWGSRRAGDLELERLNRTGLEMRCPDAAVGFQALGNEPGWNLVSDRTGVRLNRLEGAPLHAPPLPLSWRWPGGRQDRAEAALATATEGSELVARLRPQVCRDTMADAVYGFTTTVTISRPEPRTKFKGCAYLGSEPLP